MKQDTCILKMPTGKGPAAQANNLSDCSAPNVVGLVPRLPGMGAFNFKADLRAVGKILAADDPLAIGEDELRLLSKHLTSARDYLIRRFSLNEEAGKTDKIVDAAVIDTIRTVAINILHQKGASAPSGESMTEQADRLLLAGQVSISDSQRKGILRDIGIIVWSSMQRSRFENEVHELITAVGAHYKGFLGAARRLVTDRTFTADSRNPMVSHDPTILKVFCQHAEVRLALGLLEALASEAAPK